MGRNSSTFSPCEMSLFRPSKRMSASPGARYRFGANTRGCAIGPKSEILILLYRLQGGKERGTRSPG
jgi:hypothetical protein